MTTAELVLAALGCFAAGAAVNLANLRRRPAVDVAAYLVLLAGALVLAVAGVRADLGSTSRLDLGGWVGFGPSAVAVDRLAGLFLALTGVVSAPILLAFTGWARDPVQNPWRPLPALVALTLAGIVVVLTAEDAFVFLFGWESVSLAFYLLVGYQRQRPGRPRAAMLTYGISKTSGALLLLAVGLLGGATGSLTLSDWGGVHGPVHAAAFALALVAFTAKVGVVPLQVWLPAGYSAAPGPARALMSAVAANIGFYGMWRTLQVLGRPPTWIAVVLLLTAAFTALLGIAHAAVQRDLQRVIAYSSVENGGLITAAFGVALVGSVTGQQGLVAVGMLASALQMTTHAFAKSALFLASGRLEQRSGTTDLDRLTGAGRQERATAVAFSVGAFTLAGLPLTLGLVSEWFVLEAVMQLFRVDHLLLALTLAVTGAALALTAGYAGFTFVRLVGFTVLGRPGRLRPGHVRSRGTRTAPPSALSPAAAVGMLLPAAACVVLAALAPWLLRFLSAGLTPVVAPSATAGALASPWVLQPVYPGFSSLSPSWLAVELPLMAVSVLVLALLASRRSMLTVRRVPAWQSATGGVAGDGRYTSFGFANPTRHVLGSLLMTRAEHVVLDRSAHEEAESASTFAAPDLPVGPGWLSAPASATAPNGAPLGSPEPPTGEQRSAYVTDVVEMVEAFLYRPLLGPLRSLVATAKRLQSGRLDAYVAYMLMALVALLAVVVALS